MALAEITNSDWFNRGWTLQELIAPKTVHFYDRSWSHLGDKHVLSDALVSRTGIPAYVLQNVSLPQTCFIAQRMSWAAERKTTRPEDRACSLMGLFNINMPMIYGERERAFIRLQEQIIARSADESIFVWDLDLLENSNRDAKSVNCGLLATSPACFARCGDVISSGRSRGFSLSQFGLPISLPATLYVAPLNATKAKAAGQCAILLAKLPGGQSLVRISSPSGKGVLTTARLADTLKEFSVPLEPMERPFLPYPSFWLRELDFNDLHIESHDILQRRCTTEIDRLMLPEGRVTGTVGIIRIRLRDGAKSAGFGWIKFGFDFAGRPVCLMIFPGVKDESPSTKDLPAVAEKLLAIDRESPDRLDHPIFNDEWTRPSGIINHAISCDSRMGHMKRDHGFDMYYKTQFFEIRVSTSRVPETKPTGSRDAEVWAVDITAGMPPLRQDLDDQCCGCYC